MNHFDPRVLSRLKHLSVRARFVVDGLMVGLHPSRAKGFSSEFEGHREYSQGEDIRHIDWKAYGRFDRYFIKEYRETTTVRGHILLDASASMGYASNGWSKLEYGSTVAASIAYLMLKQQDAVGLVTFSNRIERMLPPKATQNHLHAVLKTLEEQEPSGQTDVGSVLQELAGTLTRKGLVILISDLLAHSEGVLRGLKQLRSRGHDVIVFHVLDKDELEFPFEQPTIFRDMEEAIKVLADPHEIRSAYQKALDALVSEYREACAAQRVDYSLFDTAIPLDSALVRYLTWRSRLRA